MTIGEVLVGTKTLTTHAHEDPSSGTMLTYVYRGLDLVATVESGGRQAIMFGQPEAHGVDRGALKQAMGIA
jgi:hypothetical protein